MQRRSWTSQSGCQIWHAGDLWPLPHNMLDLASTLADPGPVLYMAHKLDWPEHAVHVAHVPVQAEQVPCAAQILGWLEWGPHELQAWTGKGVGTMCSTVLDQWSQMPHVALRQTRVCHMQITSWASWNRRASWALIWHAPHGSTISCRSSTVGQIRGVHGPYVLHHCHKTL